jgi:hypothetical protein
MSDLFLDLRDKVSVVDFLVENLEYAPAKERTMAEKAIRAYEEGEKVPTDKLAETARKFAAAAWPARYALDRFFREEGADEEWRRVLSAVRPSTAHLLNRFRDVHETASLDEALGHAEADVALRDEERIEIEEVRKHVRHDFWKEKKKALDLLVKEGADHFQGYVHRLGKLRDIAVTLPRGLQDEAFSKIAHYEDRILFEGEVVPFELIDQEIAYYVDQKEISPLEVEGRFIGSRKRPPEI